MAAQAEVEIDGRRLTIEGRGNGPVDAFVAGVASATGVPIRVLDYHEHAIGEGASARAVAYLELRVGDSRTLFGVGVADGIVAASMKAVWSGLRIAGVALPQAAAVA